MQRSATDLWDLCLHQDDAEADKLSIRSQTLLSLAEEHVNAVDFHTVSVSWLSLYTDASLLIALLELVLQTCPGRHARWREAIRVLDMAIIVAGAVGEGRMEWIQRAIRLLQPPTIEIIKIEDSSQESHCGISDSGCLHAPRIAAQTVPTLSKPPSIEVYLDKHCDRPFVLRRLLQSPSPVCPPWPAINRWRSAQYLIGAVGEGRVVPVEVGQAYDTQDWGQQIIGFQSFLARAGYDVDGERGGPPLYLAQHPLFRQFPELQADIALPDYVWSNPAPTREMPEYVPPQTDDGIAVNVWIGSGDSEIHSPAHTVSVKHLDLNSDQDPYYNCYAQVVGQKRVWLAPPSASPFMLPHSEMEGGDDLASKYMSNTSTIPIFGHKGDFQELRTVYRDFFEHVWEDSMETVLHPGDVLIMPPGWWHAMQGEGTGPAWSVSMWY